MLRISSLRRVSRLNESLCRDVIKLLISTEPIKSFVCFLNSFCCTAAGGTAGSIVRRETEQSARTLHCPRIKFRLINQPEQG